ncbi:MAG TPA: TonB-dependent receptor, partial [Chitinophaga sp.]
KCTIPAWLGGDGLGSAVNVVLRHRNISYIDATAAWQSYNTLNGGLILKKTLDKPGIELAAGAFRNSSDNDFVMESPYQPGLKIKRDHDKFESILAGGSIRFHKRWFDEVEIEGAFVRIEKQIQGIQQNIQQAQSIGNTGVVTLGATKNNLLHNKLSLKYHGILVQANARFIDTSAYSYDWDGHRSPSRYGKGELGVGPNLALNKQKEQRQQLNLNYIVNPVFTLNLNNTLRHGHYDPRDDVGNAFAGKNLYNYPGSVLNSITGLTLETRLSGGRLLFSTALKHYYNKATGYNTNIYLQTPPGRVDNVTNTFGYNAGARYNLTHDLTVKGSFERAVRLPANAELFGDGVLITPAISLKPEVANNYTAGLLYDRFRGSNNRVQFESNIFYMEVAQMIQLAGSGLTTGYVNYANVNITGMDAEVKADLTRSFFVSANVTWQQLRDVNKYTPGTEQVKNPTYKLQVPNVPEFFTNWSLEYYHDNLLGKGTKTRMIYEGSYVQQYYYAFNISIYDNYIIPSYLTHDLTIEQSFHNERFTLTGEVHNITNARVIDNWNLPLPGRTFRVKFRCLLLGHKKTVAKE